jgi:CRP/FNR family cyclic AMP-dependent transcriptional regulator
MPKRLRKDEKVDLLAKLPLFDSCTRRDLGEIASMMVEAERPAGSVLTREGKDGGLMFVLVDGEAEVLAGTGSRVIGRLGAGEVVGELSLIDGQGRSATVRASTPVRLLELTSEDFYRLAHRSPKFVLALLRSLSARVREMDALAG